MTSSILYDPNASILGRFVSHAAFGMSQNTLPHQANLIEKTGDALLWSIEELPRHVWNMIADPKVATVGLTTLGLLSNSFFFYPIATWNVMKTTLQRLPLPSLSACRFGSYIYTSSLILGYGLRAFGRFSNAELMHQFYHHLHRQESKA